MGGAGAAAAGNVASEDDDEDYYDDYDQEYDDEYGDYGEEDGAEVINTTTNDVTEGNTTVAPDASNPATEAAEEENGEIANEEIVIDTAEEKPFATK